MLQKKISAYFIQVKKILSSMHVRFLFRSRHESSAVSADLSGGETRCIHVLFAQQYPLLCVSVDHEMDPDATIPLVPKQYEMIELPSITV